MYQYARKDTLRKHLGAINPHQTFLQVVLVTVQVAEMFYIRFLEIHFTWLIYSRLHCLDMTSDDLEMHLRPDHHRIPNGRHQTLHC